MKLLLLPLLLTALLAGANPVARAQTNPTDATPTADAKAAATLEKHLHPILAALNLNDAAKEATVRKVFRDFFNAQNAWHQANDAKVKGLWNQFNRARSKKDVVAANQALADIDAVYATFHPQHQAFLDGLAAVLSPSQIETVEDALTVNKVKVTYNVYLQIFPTLTEAQKAVVLANLKAAREQAIDAGNMAEKSAFFKKYKIKIEDEYLTAQGYNPAQARKDFGAKAKAKPEGETGGEKQ
jgi:hypothetical protein